MFLYNTLYVVSYFVSPCHELTLENCAFMTFSDVTLQVASIAGGVTTHWTYEGFLRAVHRQVSLILFEVVCFIFTMSAVEFEYASVSVLAVNHEFKPW